MFIVYENKDYYLFWKPHGLPSTFGKEKCFLEYLVESMPRNGGGTKYKVETDSKAYAPIDLCTYKPFQKYFDPSLKPVKNVEEVIKHQIQAFSKDQEFWLLNRLDNDTAGFLYFAKDLLIFDQYRQLQAQNQIEKHYIAQVSWNIAPIDKGGVGGFVIDFPIMHRSSKRMIALKDQKGRLACRFGRGKEHQVQTFIQTLEYDKKSNISTLLVKIHKWIRHQIRVHLASIGFPVIGDPLYGGNEPNEHLHLWSVGFEIVK